MIAPAGDGAHHGLRHRASTGARTGASDGTGADGRSTRACRRRHEHTTVRRRRRHGRVHGAGAGAGQAVDQRADIYAFGLIIYDMLARPRRASAPRASSQS